MVDCSLSAQNAKMCPNRLFNRIYIHLLFWGSTKPFVQKACNMFTSTIMSDLGATKKTRSTKR